MANSIAPMTVALGVFVTPDGENPERTLAQIDAAEAGRARPGRHPGPPVPAALPRHLDAAVASSPRGPTRVRLSPNVSNLPLRPPAVLAKRAATPRPAERRPVRARARRRRLLGRDRRRWAARAARRGESGRRARSRRSRHPRALDADDAVGPVRRARTTGDGRQARAAAGARHRHLARRLRPRMLRLIGAQADGWLPCLGPSEPADRAGDERRHRRGRARGGPRPREDWRARTCASRAATHDLGRSVPAPRHGLPDRDSDTHRRGGLRPGGVRPPRRRGARARGAPTRHAISPLRSGLRVHPTNPRRRRWRKFVVTEFVSADGVAEDPGGAED